MMLPNTPYLRSDFPRYFPQITEYGIVYLDVLGLPVVGKDGAEEDSLEIIRSSRFIDISEFGLDVEVVGIRFRHRGYGRVPYGLSSDSFSYRSADRHIVVQIVVQIGEYSLVYISVLSP